MKNEQNIIFALSFKLTNYCNLSCPHCWLNCGPKSPKNLLPIDTIKFYVDNWVSDLLKIKNGQNLIENIPITLTGGEIFEILNFAPEYLFEIVKIIDSYKIPLSFETNNTFIFDNNKTEQVRSLLKSIRKEKFCIKSSMDEFHTDEQVKIDSVDAAARVACFLAADKTLTEKTYWNIYIQKPTKEATVKKMNTIFKSYGITDDLEKGNYPPLTEFRFSHAKDDFCFNVCIDLYTRKQGRAALNNLGAPVDYTLEPTVIGKLKNNNDIIDISELYFNEQNIVSFNNYNPNQKISFYSGRQLKNIQNIISELNNIKYK